MGLKRRENIGNGGSRPTEAVDRNPYAQILSTPSRLNDESDKGRKEQEGKQVQLLTSLTSKEKENTAPKQSFTMARELIQQLTPSRPVAGNLFTQLEEEPELLKKAEELEAQGKLFSIISDGINAGVVGKKTILYLGRELYRQAALYGGIEGLVEHAKSKGLPITTQTIGDTTFNYPFIHLTLSEATKWIKGANNTENKKDVEEILHKLDSTINFWRSGDGSKHLKVRVLSIEAEAINKKTKQKEYLIMLRPTFLMGLSNNFITASERATPLMPKLKKEIEMNLYLYLLELLSYKGSKGYPVMRRNKEKADARIIPEYYLSGRKGKKLKTDFCNAIDMMKKEGLLLDFKEETGADNFTIYYVFTLNDKYVTAQKALPKAEEKEFIFDTSDQVY